MCHPLTAGGWGRDTAGQRGRSRAWAQRPALPLLTTCTWTLESSFCLQTSPPQSPCWGSPPMAAGRVGAGGAAADPRAPWPGAALRSADYAYVGRLSTGTRRFVLPGLAGRLHKVGHRSAVCSWCPFLQAAQAGQGGRAWAAPSGCVDAATPLTSRPRFPHLYSGGAASLSQHKGSTGPADLPRDGAGGDLSGEGREGLQITRDGPWGLFSGKHWGGNLQTLCADPLGRTCPWPLPPGSPWSCHTSRPSWASRGLSIAEPHRSPCSGLEPGARVLRPIPEWGGCLQGGCGI